MANLINKAFAQGFTSKQVLDFITKKYPKYAKQVNKALSTGFSVDQIMSFITGGKAGLTKERSQGGTEFEQTRLRDIQKREDLNRNAIATGTALTASLAAPTLIPMAANAFQRALPATLQTLVPNLIPTLTGQTGTQPPAPPTGQSPTLPQAAPATNIPQQPPIQQIPTNIPQPSTAQQPQINSTELLTKTRLKDSVDKILREPKNGPEQVLAYFQTLHPEEVKKFEKETGQKFSDVVADYAQNAQKQPLEASKAEDQTEVPKIEKSSVVATPNGIGTVKEIRGDKALVEVDGKLSKVDVSEIEPPTYSEDEIADAYDNLMAKIPEEHKSGFISWGGYDEDTNTLGFIPRGGKYEELHDITPEEAQMVKDATGTARTTGETREGLWVMGESTRGGIISQIIHDRRRRHEAEEKKQLKLDFELPKLEKQDKGMKPIFDEMAYARGLSRERERKVKLEERERKKKERDEAKKRKKKQA